MPTNSSVLAAWARFGTLTLFERRVLLQYDLVLPNSSTHVATLYLGPMGSLWAYIEGMDGLSLHFQRPTAPMWLPAGQVSDLASRTSLKKVCSSSSMIWCFP